MIENDKWEMHILDREKQMRKKDITSVKELIDLIPNKTMRRSLIHCSIEEGIVDELLSDSNISVENQIHRLVGSTGCRIRTAAMILDFWTYLLNWPDVDETAEEETITDENIEEADIYEEFDEEEDFIEIDTDPNLILDLEDMSETDNKDECVRVADSGDENEFDIVMNTKLKIWSLGFQQERKEKINTVLDKFADKERSILQYRFGIDDGKCHIFSEIEERYEINQKELHELEIELMQCIELYHSEYIDVQMLSMDPFFIIYQNDEEALEELRQRMVLFFDALTEDEQRIIIKGFGITNVRVRTLEDAGIGFYIMRDRIRQIEEKVLRIVSGGPIRRRKLKNYLD